jgi:hypothetical protein
MTKAYPARFFLVHVAFSNPRFADAPWGELGDGPVLEGRDVLDKLDRHFDDSEPSPSLDNMRVWMVSVSEVHGPRITDVSDTFLDELLDAREEDEE